MHTLARSILGVGAPVVETSRQVIQYDATALWAARRCRLREGLGWPAEAASFLDAT